MDQKCCKCACLKPLVEFNRDRSRPSGRARRCKECDRAYSAAYYAAHRAERAAYYQQVKKQGKHLRGGVSRPTWIPQTLLCPVCCADFTQGQWGQKYCSVLCRQRRRGARNWKPKPSSTKRGYGTAHRRERLKWKPLVEAGLASCSLCEQPIAPEAAWHLDHTDDRSGYRGVAHAVCNLREGGRRRHRLVRERRERATRRREVTDGWQSAGDAAA